MKKLTKAEIKFIDQYLIKNEVKFWDVRLELLDHIVSAVEDKINKEGISFNEALLDVHRGFGNQLIKDNIPQKDLFKKGLYQANNGFIKMINQKKKEVFENVRKETIKHIKASIKSLHTYIEILAIMFLVFFIAKYFSFKVAAYSILIILSIPIFVLNILLFIEKCFRKSIIEQAFYVTAPLILGLLNLWLSIKDYSVYKNLELDSNNICFIFLAVFSFIVLRSQLLVFLKIRKAYKSLYKLNKEHA